MPSERWKIGRLTRCPRGLKNDCEQFRRNAFLNAGTAWIILADGFVLSLHYIAVSAVRGWGSTILQYLSQVIDQEVGVVGGYSRTQSPLFPPHFFTKKTFWIATCLERPLHMSYTVRAAVVTAVIASISTPASQKAPNGTLQIYVCMCICMYGAIQA